jgi:hypothetical protein
VLLLPLTIAVNCCVLPVCNETEVGLMLTETVGGGGGGALTFTVADADLLVSAALVAVTVCVPAVFGAV